MSKTDFSFQRGEVYLVEEAAALGPEKKKTRHWVLVGANPVNSARGTVIAIPLSKKTPVKLPLSVEVSVNNSKAAALIDQIRAIDKERFQQCDGILSDPEMNQINNGLRRALALG